MKASNVSYDANEFTGKRILVTGGSMGIGEAIVNRLLRADRSSSIAGSEYIIDGGNIPTI